jgi:hypothetical protein
LDIGSFSSTDSYLKKNAARFWKSWRLPSGNRVWTYQRQADGSYLNRLTLFRVSGTAHEEWFSSELKAILRRVEKRLHRLFGADPAHLESWQATNYCRQGKFDYHLDAGYWDDHYAGDRILTFLLYLRTSLKGGGTYFRALDTYVDARAGRLLVWENLFPNGSVARMAGDLLQRAGQSRPQITGDRP